MKRWWTNPLRTKWCVLFHWLLTDNWTVLPSGKVFCYKCEESFEMGGKKREDEA